MHRYLILILSCTLSGILFGQSTPKQVLDKAISVLEDMNYQTDVHYASYTDESGHSPEEEYRGFYKLFDDGYVQRIDQVLTVQQDSLCIIVNEQRSQILLSGALPELPALGVDISDFENSHFDLSLEKKEGAFEIHMVFKGQYSDIEKIVARYDSSTYYPEGLTLFYKSPDQSAKATRIEITFENFSASKPRSSEDELASYILVNSDDFEIIHPAYKTYTKLYKNL